MSANTPEDKSIKTFLPKTLTGAQLSVFPSHIQQLTTYQHTFLQILPQKLKKVFLETNIPTGKCTALILHFISQTLSVKSTGSIVPITLCLFPHKTFVNKFHKKLNLFRKFNDSIGCEFFLEDDAISAPLESPKRRVFLGTLQDCIKLFQEEKVGLHEVDSVIVSDLDYLPSFGQTNNFWRMFNYFKAKDAQFLGLIDIVLITNEDPLEEIQKIKKGFEFEFTLIKIKREIKQPLPAQIKSNKKSAQGSELFKAVFNQYFFIGSRNQNFSLLYLLIKFELFPVGTVIVTDTINTAYLITTFLERAQLGKVKTYNPNHPISLKAYNISLFNAKQAEILVTSKAFIEDYSKNKSKISSIRGIKNLIFLNAAVSNEVYSQYLELLQGETNFLSPDAHFDLNVLFLVESLEKNISRGDIDAENEGSYLQAFNTLLTEQERIYHKVLFEPIFVEEKDVNLFTYRIDSVLQTLSPKQIKIVRAIEMNKIILKSRKMKEYFLTHENEKELLLSKLGKLAQAAKKNEITLPKEIPEYLLPTFAKNAVAASSKVQKVMAESEAFKKKGEKGKPETQVRTKREGQKFSDLVNPNENPVTSDPSSLKTFSSHKLWKIRHHKIHKRDDKKLALKGIYKL